MKIPLQTRIGWIAIDVKYAMVKFRRSVNRFFRGF